MKKATIGMVMLVCLVLTKAYISKDQHPGDAELGRGNTEISSLLETKNLRLDLYNGGLVPAATLIAQVNPIKIEETEIVSSQEHSDFQEKIVESVKVEQTNQIIEEDLKEEVVPMDYISNTGYGLLKTTTEHIISKNDRIGKEPLDNSNTISDNISKMFPRMH